MPANNYEKVYPQDSHSLGLPEAASAPPVYPKSDQPDPLNEAALKQFFSAMFSSADEHRKPREEIWKVCWALYNNQTDFSSKAWWQHKASIPKIRASVDKACGIFRKTLLRMYPFYGIQAESKLGRTKGRYSMLLTDYWFDQIGIIEHLVNAFKIGLITSVSGAKIWMARVKDFDPEVTQTQNTLPSYEYGVQTSESTETIREVNLKSTFRGQLAVMELNPSNIWIVPGTNRRCIIERFEMPLSEAESLAKEGVYEKEAVKRLRDKVCNTQEIAHEVADQTGEGKASSNKYLRSFVGYHYWGDIYDDQGNLIACDNSFTLAEKEILIRKARPNPFFHKNPPYVIGSPYPVPFSTYDRGMVEDVGEIARSITEMANLVADGALYDAMKMFAIDTSQLDDPSEAKQGAYPGKMWLRDSSKAMGPGEPLVQTVDVGKIPSEAMNMIALFEKYLQEGTYVNEWVGGFGGKGDRTLGEVNIKTQSALEGLDEAARNLEVNLIEPSVTMSAQVIYQYHENYLLPRLVDNYPQLSVMLQDMQPAERYAIMIKDFAFKVRGLSMMIDRQQRMGELKEILTLLSYLPGFIEQLDPQVMMEEILQPMGWDPRRLMINQGQGGVTTPMIGANNPQQLLAPPGSMTQNSPMQQMNADQGAQRGGATNNPAVRGGNQNPQAALMMALRQMMAGRR